MYLLFVFGQSRKGDSVVLQSLLTQAKCAQYVMPLTNVINLLHPSKFFEVGNEKLLHGYIWPPIKI